MSDTYEKGKFGLRLAGAILTSSVAAAETTTVFNVRDGATRGTTAGVHLLLGVVPLVEAIGIGIAVTSRVVIGNMMMYRQQNRKYTSVTNALCCSQPEAVVHKTLDSPQSR